MGRVDFRTTDVAPGPTLSRRVFGGMERLDPERPDERLQRDARFRAGFYRFPRRSGRPSPRVAADQRHWRWTRDPSRGIPNALRVFRTPPVDCPVNKFAMIDLSRGVILPAKRLYVLRVGRDIPSQLPSQIRCRRENAARQHVPLNFREPQLDLIQPRRNALG